MNIWFGTNENAHLSNLAKRPFKFKENKYQSVEHAYQTLKSGTFDEYAYREGKKSNKAIGRLKANTKNNWNIDLMYTLILESFLQNPKELIWLKLTHDKVLTHNQDKGIWRTKFPELLMQVREEFVSGKYKNFNEQI